MDITFDCGQTAKNVGVIALAARAHIGKCEHAGCQVEVTDIARKAGLTS